jgi:predicted nucleotidyltransferase
MVEREDLDKIKNIIDRFIDLLKKKNIGISKVYLFGSYSQNKQNEYSDIDIALVLPHIVNFFDESINLTLIGSYIDSRIEPHLFLESEFNEANPFARDILKNGLKIL